MKKQIEFGLVAILLLTALAGIAAMLRQMVQGLSLTALQEPVVWGLYVVGFAYFAGIGAGALTWTAVLLRWGDRQQQKLVKTGALVTLTALTAAGIFINMDLGRPDRVWRFLVNANLASPLVLDFLFMNVMVGLGTVFAIYSLRQTIIRWTPHRMQRMTHLLNRFFADQRDDGTATAPKWLRTLALITAFAVPLMYLLMARVFTTLQARPDWNTTAGGITFLGSSILAGAAAILLTARLLGSVPARQAAATPVVQRILIGLILFELLLAVSPILTLYQFQGTPRLASLAHIDTVWILKIILGLVTPLLLLLPGLTKRESAFMTPAGLFILTGIFLKRWHIIISVMRERSLPLASGVYIPSLHEYIVAAGIISIAVLLLYFSIRISGSQFGFKTEV